MKILSPYKDYYDYLQGVYGIDEKIVYERTCYASINSKGEWQKTGLYKPMYLSVQGYEYEVALLAICGTLYRVYIINGKFYFGLNKGDFKEGKYAHITRLLPKDKYNQFTSDLHDNSSYYRDGDITKDKYHLTKTDLNEKNDCPVLLVKQYYGSKIGVEAKNIKLSDFGIGQIISPHDIYITISNFLSREKPIVDKRTDIQKIVGKGFDKKISFRNVKNRIK
jgi:hypothetical protein